MAQILATIHQDHRNYSGLLGLLRSDVKKLQGGENPDFIRLYDIMNYMTNQPDVSHHPVEEFIFTTLKQKVSDLIPQLDALSNEHRQIALLGLTLKEKLSYITSGSIISKDDIIEAADNYCELLTNHIRTEEEKVLPVAEKMFSAEDWAQLSTRVDHMDDPLFGDVVHEQFADLYQRIALSKDTSE